MDNIKKIIGGKFILGQMKMILDHVLSYVSGDAYKEYLKRQQDWKDKIVQEMNRLKAEKNKEEGNRLKEI
jgi:hypothetical protein